VSSGTAAIHLALLLLGVKPGDTVFCSSLTFVGSCNPILYCGAQPVFIDSDRESWNMSPEALERALEWAKREGRLPRCVIVVNLYGQSADMDALVPLCERYGVPVLEDAAESLGAQYKGRASGSFGRIGIYSFNGNKIITTSGGGMLVADDPALVERARKLATQAREPAPHYEHVEVGFNYRMSNVLAGIGRGQLRVLDQRVAQRREVFERYRRELSDLPQLAWMPEPTGCRSTRWLTCFTLAGDHASERRDLVLRALERHSIEARPVWKPMHLQPLFRGAPYFPHLPALGVEPHARAAVPGDRAAAARAAARRGSACGCLGTRSCSWSPISRWFCWRDGPRSGCGSTSTSPANSGPSRRGPRPGRCWPTASA
jgi:dTDP-4-amino-4,6-dideoxygalactose transaminase